MLKPWGVLVLLCITHLSILSQGLFESSQTEEVANAKVEFNGFVRGSAYGGSELYDYSNVFGEYCLQTKLTQAKAYLYADLRFRSGIYFNKEYTIFQLKEAYAGYQSDKFDAFLGNQIVNWGRTDGFNPTNNITPIDYFFLSADIDDQKMSNFMLRIKYRFSPTIDIDIIGIPFYSPSNYRFDLFDTGEGVSFGKAILPNKTFQNSSFASRLNFEFSGIGFSFSYFRGYDPFHGFDVQSIDLSTGTPIVVNTAIPYLKNTIGTDFALPIKSWILRGELAYNITTDYEIFMHIPNPDIAYVAGLEHNFWGITTIVQYIGKYTLDFTELQQPELTNPIDPFAQMQYAEEMIIYESTLFNRKTFYQQEEINHAAVFSLNKSFSYDTWDVALAGYYNITSNEFTIRPKVTWKISDILATSIGGNYLRGDENSIFDYSAPVLNGVFVELKAIF